MTNSSATATYLQQSSATATYLQQSSATATYFNLSQLPNVTKNLYVDNGRTNTYTPDGTYIKPFTTIQAAVNQIITNADNLTVPYQINIAQGIYPETVTLEDVHLSTITFNGEWGVRIGSAGYLGAVLKSTKNNSQITDLEFHGITFAASQSATSAGIALVGDTNGTTFGGTGINFYDSQFTSNVSTHNFFINVGGVQFFDCGFNWAADITNVISFFLGGGAHSVTTGSTFSVVTNNSLNKPSGFSSTLLNIRAFRDNANVTIDAGSTMSLAQASLQGGTVNNSGTLTNSDSAISGTLTNNVGGTYNEAGGIHSTLVNNGTYNRSTTQGLFEVIATTAQITGLGTNTNVCTDASSNLTTATCNNGTVTSVGASAPITTSGGNTPTIGLSQTIAQAETFTSSVTVTGAGGITTTFGVNASTFAGNGSAITNLNGPNITTVIPTTVLPSTIAYTTISNTFTSPQTITSSLTVTGAGGIASTFGVKAATAQITGLSTNTNVCTDGSSNLTTSNCNQGVITYSSFSATQPILYNSVTGAFSATLISATTGFMGTLQAAQFPALTGDISTSAGSLATTANSLQNNITTFGSSQTVNGAGGETVAFGITAATGTFFTTSPTANALIVKSTNNVTAFSVANSSVTVGDYMLTVASATTGVTAFAVNTYGMIFSSGTQPTVGSCGTTPKINAGSTDMVGSITWSGAATTCAVNFSHTFGTAPFCFAETSGASFAEFSTSTSAMSWTLNASLTGGTLQWFCLCGSQGC
jgi:hypothetical protein